MTFELHTVLYCVFYRSLVMSQFLYSITYPNLTLFILPLSKVNFQVTHDIFQVLGEFDCQENSRKTNTLLSYHIKEAAEILARKRFKSPCWEVGETEELKLNQIN